MRTLSKNEIKQLMDEIVWGTLIVLDGDNPMP